jgi:hypothetical protein
LALAFEADALLFGAQLSTRVGQRTPADRRIPATRSRLLYRKPHQRPVPVSAIVLKLPAPACSKRPNKTPVNDEKHAAPPPSPAASCLVLRQCAELLQLEARSLFSRAHISSTQPPIFCVLPPFCPSPDPRVSALHSAPTPRLHLKAQAHLSTLLFEDGRLQHLASCPAPRHGHPVRLEPEGRLQRREDLRHPQQERRKFLLPMRPQWQRMDADNG